MTLNPYNFVPLTAHIKLEIDYSNELEHRCSQELSLMALNDTFTIQEINLDKKNLPFDNKLKKIEAEGDAGGNLVKVVLTGDFELKSIKISKEAEKENREVLNDLIIAAYNNAKEKIKKKSNEELTKLTGGIQLPFNIKPPF